MPAESIVHDALPERLRALHRLWAGRRRPTRADFTFAMLKPWLGHLALFDHGPSGFRFRLCGTELIPRFTREATGLALHALDPAVRAGVEPLLGDARDGMRAACAVAHVDFEARRTEYCDLALPLFGAGDAVSELLFASYAVRQVRPYAVSTPARLHAAVKARTSRAAAEPATHAARS